MPVPDSEARGLSPVEAAQAGLTWRISRRLAWAAAGKPWDSYPDEEVAASSTSAILPIMAPTMAAAPLQAAAAAAVTTSRRIKASLVVDQMDESEIVPADPGVIEQWHENYVQIKSAPCPLESEPSDDQLQGLYYRVSIARRTPYVDLAIWGLFGRKTYKRNKLRTWIPDGRGGYNSHDIPGPESHSVWLIGWRVFVAAALMLQIVSCAALEAYERRIEKMVKLWGDAWHLIYQADDWMRAEILEKIRRQLQANVTAGHPVPKCWAPNEPTHPWSAAFFFAAHDNEFWDDNVVHPATSWRSSGRRGALLSQEEELIGTSSSSSHRAKPHSTEQNSPQGGSRNRSRTTRIQKLRSQVDHLQGGHQTSAPSGGKSSKGKANGVREEQGPAGMLGLLESLRAVQGCGPWVLLPRRSEACVSQMWRRAQGGIMLEAGLVAATQGTPARGRGLGDGGLFLGAPNFSATSTAADNVIKTVSLWELPRSARAAFESGTGVCIGYSNASGTADRGRITAFTKSHAEEVRTMLDWLRAIPGYPTDADYFSLQLNRDAVLGKHRDKYNRGCSWFFLLGNFTGGDLLIDEGSGFVPLEARNHWVKFNGQNVHYTESFTG